MPHYPPVQPNKEAAYVPQQAYAALALVAFGVFIAADDLTVISTMLPQMIFDFEIPLPAGLDDASWIVSGYLMTHIVAMPLLGRVSDLYGRRLLFIGCMVVFAIGSLLVAQAATLNVLIAARVVQAIGGGGVVPVAMAVVGDQFPPGRRAWALGLLGAVDTLGWIIGPLYGAFWVRYFTWHWQFYINIPISLLAAAGAWLLLRDVSEPQSGFRLDWGGAVTLSLALVLINVGLASGGGHAATGPSFDFSTANAGPTWPHMTAYLTGGGLALLTFVWLERRAAQPLIDLRMFRATNFSMACLLNFVIGFALIVAMVNVPLFVNAVLARGATLDDYLKAAAVESGQILSALTVAMAATSVLGGWICGRLGYRAPIATGLWLMSAGFGLMSDWTPAMAYGAMAWQLALAGAGFGLVTAPVGAAVINAVAAEVRGVASGLMLILRLMGMSVGLSSLTAWGLYRFEILSLPYSVAEIGQHLQAITAQILTETFLAVAILALVVSVTTLFIQTRE
jgi:EmrB/QacA subfamily drug resistance transporter